jgi:hypothetical protein
MRPSSNVETLFTGGTLGWRPQRQAAVVTPRPVVAAMRASPDVMDQCAVAMHRVMVERHVGFTDAEDHLIRSGSDLWTRAIKAFVDEPQLATAGAFGSGGGAKVASGQGTSRRVFNVAAFRARLRERISALQSPSPSQAA